ncbi:MAG TPA: hypothetical protein VF178_07480 [Gemmatimonadaceae bacterium]
MHRRLHVLALAMAVTGMGAQCFSVTDPFVVSVNVRDLTGTYDVAPGTVTFDPSCTTVVPQEYLGSDYDLIEGARLVDVTVRTEGSFAATVNNAAITVDGTPVVSYSGSWDAFNTERSLLRDPTLVTTNQAGVDHLLDAVERRQPVSICHTGSFSEAAPAGLRVVVNVFAQVDATP